ncbi:T9SS type A sorting domain-containing protein [Hymenobacter gummosus]|uniref:T9SS type A sorting domain-containing protein n=1 Tax=Hymenobacter gummosus TaxID=1776032 RepID=A0A3S0JE51_9BACT|nr:PA14 domain-containing protein [Hymenobacter gummosus]RTQ46498.1 T9SS type A sorting domain-containing protein [Hymenobacter gummosus]
MRRLILCSLVAGLSSGIINLTAAPGPGRPDDASDRTGTGTGLTASYYTNGTLAGAPVLRRVDPSIDFRWGMAAPAPGVPEDNFSVRWEGLVAAPGTGNYRFVARTDDEVRLWINGKVVLDTWNGKKKNAEGTVGLAAGEKATIKLEFAEADGDAHLQLQWAGPGQAPQLIPTSYLYPLEGEGMPTAPEPVAAAPAPAAPKPVAKASAEVDKAENKIAKAEAKAENRLDKAENKVAKAEAKADKASAKVVEAEKAAAEKAAADKAAQAQADKTAQAEARAAARAKAAADKAAANAPDAPAIVEPGVYVLTSRTTGQPLQVLDPSRPNSRAYQDAGVTAPGARSEAPQWRIESLGNGYYRLLVPGNNKVLEVLGSSTSNGTPMNVWTYYSGNNQLWKIEPTENGYYKLLAKHSNKALSIRDSIDGIVQWRYSGKEGQMWKLTPVQEETPAPLIMAGARPGVGAHKMSIYPNPSNGVVQLRYELPEAIPMGWVLYNQNGAPVRVSDYRRQNAGAHHQTLDFTGLPPGDYNLRMTVGTVTTREQLQLRKQRPADAPAPAGE